QGLASRWGLADEVVIMGSRSQEKANRISTQVNEKLGKKVVIPKTNEECVKEANVILLTVPFQYAVSTLEPLLKYFTSDHILVDVTVPLKPFEKGKMVDVLPESDIGAKSATELLRKIVPKEIPVVGAFKTLSNSTLQDIDRLPVLNQDVFILGKDKEAKSIVKEKAELIKNLRAVDAGGTLSARHVEHFTAFLIGLNKRYKTHDCGFIVSGLTSKNW
ncbi:MAG: NADPH-dependent F420 reductase, partial [Candidatus Hodarchaeales archaeon]